MNLNKSLGLKPTLLYKDENDLVPFKNVVVPSSMRSPYWKYFGFPANENREIITKSKIICCLCYQHVAYNRNTTNLSTHLKNKHPELLAEISIKREATNNPSESESSPMKRSMKEETVVNWYSNNEIRCSPIDDKGQGHPTGITQKSYMRGKKGIYKPKFQLSEEMELEANEHESQYIETIDYANIDINEEGNEIIAEALDTQTVNDDKSKDEFLSAQYITINENNEVLFESTPEKIVIATHSPTKGINKMNVNHSECHEPAEVMEQIKKFLIKDLMPLSIVDGSGFKEMITFFSQSNDIPSSSEIDRSIEKEYNQQHSRAISSIKAAITNRNYSLLFHKLGDSPIVEISVNYWLDGGCDRISSLENQMFCISKNCRNFVLSFGESLSNCSAFLVDFDLESEFEGSIQELLSDIPIIPTFSYVTKMAFDACMELTAVQSAIESADEILGGKVKASHTWLQKFDCLTQFLNDTDNIDNGQIIQVFIECLQPLKNCLDVLAFETSAYVSIMKPVALQLINQHYNNCEENESVESDIAVLEKDLKQTILKVFQQTIIDNPFLVMASFLDPRFQRLTAPDDLKSIRDDLGKSVQNDDAKLSESRSAEARQSKPKLERSFGLSSLFSNISPATKPKPPKNRFDIEFRSYTEDVSLDMELCPLEWWTEHESLYPSIKQNVKKYFCVPSFVNNLHRLPLHEQEGLEQKYGRLENGEANEQMLWLHLSELRQRSSES